MKPTSIIRQIDHFILPSINTDLDSLNKTFHIFTDLFGLSTPFGPLVVSPPFISGFNYIYLFLLTYLIYFFIYLFKGTINFATLI